MKKSIPKPYIKGFLPYAFAALLVGLVGGFTTVLGPAFVSDLNIAYSNTTWTALSTAISTAALAPVMGKIADVAGRRKTLLSGIALFTLGNTLTAISRSLLFMMFARFIVGAGTAAIAPVIMAYIVTEFPKEETAKGFSLYMLISSASVILGPTIGGIIIARSSWRVMMWICTAISMIVLFLCLFTLKKTPQKKKSFSGFDHKGAFMVLVFFSLMLCIPSFGQNFGWSSVYFTSVLIASVISLILLILAERKAENPVLSGKFMLRKEFILSVTALFLTQGLMQANMTNLIVFINYTQPDNTLISSYAISVMYIGMSLGSVIAGPVADKKEPKNVLFLTFILTGIGCAIMFLFDIYTSAILLMASLGILGFGLGGNAAIFMKIVLSGLPAQAAGAGTGTYGLFRDLSAPFGVAVFVPMFTNGITDRILSGLSPETAATASIKSLALVEVICVSIGIAVVLSLPRIHHKTEHI
ncbi:MAG: MFS transporter [Lachnospiraceae bacterium]|nr:MFS transporter [Lachnospiraceae bacterium]